MKIPSIRMRRRKAPAGQVIDDLSAEARAVIDTEMRRMQAIMAPLKVLELIDRHQYGEATRYIIGTLDVLPSDDAEPAVPLILNLGYLLVVSDDARHLVSADVVAPLFKNAVQWLIDNMPEDELRVANAYNNLGSLLLLCRDRDPAKLYAESLEAYDIAAAIYANHPAGLKDQLTQILLNRSDLLRKRAVGDPALNVELARQVAEYALENARVDDLTGRARAHYMVAKAALNAHSGGALLNWVTAEEHFSASVSLWKISGRTDDLIEDLIGLGSAQFEVGRMTADAAKVQAGIRTLEDAFSQATSRNLSVFTEISGIELLLAWAGACRLAAPDGQGLAEARSLARSVSSSLLQSQRMPLVPSLHAAYAAYLAAAGSTLSDPKLLMRAKAHAQIACRRWVDQADFGKASALLADLGVEFERSGDREAAEGCYDQALEIAAKLSNRALTMTSRSHLFSHQYRAANAKACIMTRRGALREAAMLIDGIVAQSLFEGLAAPLSAEERLLSEERSQLLAILEGARTVSLALAETAVARIREITRILHEPNHLHQANDINSNWEWICDACPDEGILIIPVVGPSSASLLCAFRTEDGNSSSVAIEAIGCDDLDQIVRNVLAAMPRSDGGGLHRSIEEMPPALRSLGEAICRPISRFLIGCGFSDDCRVLFLSHGMLSLVPWNAAVWSDGSSDVTLDTFCTFSAVPSLRWVSQRTVSQRRRVHSVSLIVDPLDDLPGARLEQQVIERTLPNPNFVSLRGRQVTSEGILAALDDSELVHLAMHSSFNWSQPMYSALQLCDGEVRVGDLLALSREPAAIVILSACSSGVSNALDQSTESWSFPRVLHLAGVGAVISSHWDVLDVAMLLLFSEYYSHPDYIVAPASALRAARSFLRTVSMAEARQRIETLSGINSIDKVKCLDDLAELALSHGHDAPFAHAVYSGAMEMSGVQLLDYRRRYAHNGSVR